MPTETENLTDVPIISEKEYRDFVLNRMGTMPTDHLASALPRRRKSYGYTDYRQATHWLDRAQLKGVNLSDSVPERHNHHQPRLLADGPGRMSLAGKVFRQNHLAGPEALHGAIAQTDLNCTSECNHVLTARRIMPIDGGSGSHPRESHAGRRLQRSLLGELSGRERQLQFFQMRLLIVTGVQTEKSHGYHLCGNCFLSRPADWWQVCNSPHCSNELREPPVIGVKKCCLQ